MLNVIKHLYVQPAIVLALLFGAGNVMAIQKPTSDASGGR